MTEQPNTAAGGVTWEGDFCQASVYRGEWSTLRTEPCGKPAKGERLSDSSGVTFPVCGIHKRPRWVLRWQERHR